MSDQFVSQMDDKGAFCDWCEKPLGADNTYRKSVCIRCYQMLKDAGIKEEEIFSVKTRDNNRRVKAATNTNEGRR